MNKIESRKSHLVFLLCILMFWVTMLSCNVSASETYPTEKKEWVEAVNITITAPEIGKNPVYVSKMDSFTMRSQGYGFEVSEWMEKSGNQSRYLTVNDRFETGKTYTALIYVEAHPLYSLYATLEEKEALLEKSRVNGIKPGIEYSSDSGESMILTVDFIMDTYLNSVDITITEPAEDLTPSNTKATVNKGACTAEILTWMKKDSENYNGLVGETEKFEAGQTYSAYVAVYPKNGFFIDVTEQGRKAFLGSSRVNGMTPYVGGPFSGWTADGSEFIFQIDLTVKEKAPTDINGIDIAIATPVNGQKPNFNATVNKGACTAFVADWKAKDGAPLEGNSTFSSGKTYTAYVWVEAKDGYKFDATSTGRANLLKNSKVNGFTPAMDSHADSGSSVILTVNIMAEEAANTILKEKKTKASYMITKSESGEKAAVFLKPQNTKITKVTIPSKVTLNGITYKVTGIANNAFKNCKKLTSVTIGENVTSIGKSAFSGCIKLKTVNFGKRLVLIGESAFSGCKVLSKANLPAGVVTIGKSAFSGCTKLKSVNLGKNVTTIGDKAFYKCTALTKVMIPEKVTRIGKSAFYSCTKLKSVTLGINVTKIDEKAFYKCTSLTKIIVPAKVEKIGKQAFYGCKKLKSIVLQTMKLNAGNVGEKAFSGIYSKAVIKAPKSQLDNYKNLLRKRGVSKKVKFGK